MAGSYNLRINIPKNPGAFTPGVNYNWSEIIRDDRTFQILSEGEHLVVREVLEKGEVKVVSNKKVELSNSENHNIIITWWDEGVKVYWDGKLHDTYEVIDG